MIGPPVALQELGHPITMRVGSGSAMPTEANMLCERRDDEDEQHGDRDGGHAS